MELTQEERAYIQLLVKGAASAQIALRQVGTLQKNEAIEGLAALLDENRAKIKIENAVDIEYAIQNSYAQSMVDRLLLDDKAIDSIIKSMFEIAALKDPVGDVVSGTVLPNGLNLQKVRVPIGVVTIIYESRPNVTVDVGALGLKSSNAVILRGGKEALHSNKILARMFQKALSGASIPVEAVQLVEKTNRNLMYGLLRMKDHIDLVVPRGGSGLINYVTENSLIPVVKHDKGVCHVYIHPSAEKEMAIKLVLNSKVKRPGVCNAAETLLLDENFEFSTEVLNALAEAGVTLRGDKKTQDRFSTFNMEPLTEEGYDKEYLGLEISIKAVDNLEAAIAHINEYSSSHSEAIIAQDFTAINVFTKSLDSAALFVNASTYFHDGGQFGFGAEVGISTGKLHCRGPMGLTDLTTTKYIVTGNGQIRT
ncbi:MAG: glutamate-5-semialdehyde dehydrogenase [Leptospirales bacterium]